MNSFYAVTDQYRYIKTNMWGFHPDDVATIDVADENEEKKTDFPQLPGTAD